MQIRPSSINIDPAIWPCPNDWLNREAEIKNLTPLLLNIQTPAVMALNASWGEGKTTFVRLWQAYLNKENYQFVYFNAWESDFAADPLVPMLASIDQWLKRKDPALLEQDAWKSVKKIGGKMVKVGIKAGVSVATMGILNASEAVEGVIADATGEMAGDVLDGFSRQSVALDDLRKNIQLAVDSAKDQQNNLIFFIDELDRCRPTYAVELLERIKHLFSINGIVFVLSVDVDQLSESVKAVYGDGFDGRKYLKRFFDFDYKLQVASPEQYVFKVLDQPDIKACFQKRTQDHKTTEYISTLMGIYSERFRLSLRDIDQLVCRLRVILTIVESHDYLDAPALISLLVLREKSDELYREYIKNPYIADKVIHFLLEGVPPEKRMLRPVAVMIGLLIAPTWPTGGATRQPGEHVDYQELLKPYQDMINVGQDSPAHHYGVLVKQISQQSRNAFDDCVISTGRWKRIIEFAERINV